eukprot:scaffold104966_cov13-Tisochrysis_lutea.AAC.1
MAEICEGTATGDGMRVNVLHVEVHRRWGDRMTEDGMTDDGRWDGRRWDGTGLFARQDGRRWDDRKWDGRSMDDRRWNDMKLFARWQKRICKMRVVSPSSQEGEAKK